VAPARSVYVDDLTHNAEAAAAYGFDALLFTGAAALRTELTDRGLLAVAAHSAT
jgi:2-haloacid dehalogenase